MPFPVKKVEASHKSLNALNPFSSGFKTINLVFLCFNFYVRFYSSQWTLPSRTKEQEEKNYPRHKFQIKSARFKMLTLGAPGTKLFKIFLWLRKNVAFNYVLRPLMARKEVKRFTPKGFHTAQFNTSLHNIVVLGIVHTVNGWKLSRDFLPL